MLGRMGITLIAGLCVMMTALVPVHGSDEFPVTGESAPGPVSEKLLFNTGLHDDAWYDEVVNAGQNNAEEADDEPLIDETSTGKIYEIDVESPAGTGDIDDKEAVKPSDKDEKKPEGKESKKAAAEKKKPARVKVFMGTWDESCRNASRSADYCFSYYGLNYGNLHMRFDTFNYDRRRYWLTYGKIVIAKSPGFTMNISPSIMINNVYIASEKKKRDQFYEGAFTTITFPKLGLSILDKSYGGTDGDFHHTFADLRILKWLDLSYFNYASIKAIPDSYLGPKVKFNVGKDASFHVWYGWSLVNQKPDARLLNITGAFTF